MVLGGRLYWVFATAIAVFLDRFGGRPDAYGLPKSGV
jgi:hypothetical protein